MTKHTLLFLWLLLVFSISSCQLFSQILIQERYKKISSLEGYNNFIEEQKNAEYATPWINSAKSNIQYIVHYKPERQLHKIIGSLPKNTYAYKYIKEKIEEKKRKQKLIEEEKKKQKLIEEEKKKQRLIEEKKEEQSLIDEEKLNKEHVILLKKGKRKVKNYEDAILLNNASNDLTIIKYPPLEPTDDLNSFFAWGCPLKKKFNQFYICWHNRFAKGYAFTKIKKKFGVLRIDGKYHIVGRYIGNTEIMLISGESKTIPVLSDVYIFED